jgi:multidrug resistance efflux pump
MKTFYGICLFAVAFLVGITIFMRSESTRFYGIADTKETVISSENAVEIRKIRVTNGQTVHQGDTLVELLRPDLDLKISEISHQLDELKVRSSAHATLSRSEVRQLKAEQQERANQIVSQIRQLEAQYEINRNLVSELHSVKPDNGPIGASDDNPIIIRIDALKRDLQRVKDSSQITVDRLNNELSYAGDPLYEQVKRLEDELTLLSGEKRKLFIAAQIPGLIGAVNFKDGEKVSPFAPILTLHAESPSYVVGYIHENTSSEVAPGQKVTVLSMADSRRSIAGEVIGVGSRIVEYPVRLRKIPDLQIWGREVMIRIPPENRFLLGEKVLISLSTLADHQVFHWFTRDQALVTPAFAVEKPTSARPAVTAVTPLHAIRELTRERKNRHLEASGALYLDDLGRYLILGDETKHGSPYLYLMDDLGTVTKRLTIEGVDRIDDMESLTANEHGTLYIAASQSASRNGMTIPTRTLFLRIKRKGESLRLDKSISLLGALDEAARKFPEERWASFVSRAVAGRSIDIEGIACRGQTAYFGFKKPLLDDSAVVLAVRDIDSLFAGRQPRRANFELFLTFALVDSASGKSCGISDLCFQGGFLYMLSSVHYKTGNTHCKGGTLWAVNVATKTCSALYRFTGAKPEGIAYNGVRKEFLVTFDNGGDEPSQLMTVRRTDD